MSRKIKADEMALVLFNYLEKKQDSVRYFISGWFPEEEPDIPMDLITNESYHLTIFAIDFAVHLRLGETDTKRTLLFLFYEHVIDNPLSMQGSSESPYDANSWQRCLQQRQMIYTNALKMPCQAGFLEIGGAFANLCGRPKHLKLALVGVEIFESTLEVIRQTLSQFKIK